MKTYKAAGHRHDFSKYPKYLRFRPIKPFETSFSRKNGLPFIRKSCPLLTKPMKKAVLSLLFASVATVAIADIQAPPASKDGVIRKLSRSISNLVYGFSEVPSNYIRVLENEGRTAAASYGILKGVEKTVVRVGYGLYELFTFPAPTYKDGYGSPYYKKDSMDPREGYEEFPPQLGYISEAKYNRTQSH